MKRNTDSLLVKPSTWVMKDSAMLWALLYTQCSLWGWGVWEHTTGGFTWPQVSVRMWMTAPCTSIVETLGSHGFPLISPYLFSVLVSPSPGISSFPIWLYKLSPPVPICIPKSFLEFFQDQRFIPNFWGVCIGPTSEITKVKSLCIVERAVRHLSNHII